MSGAWFDEGENASEYCGDLITFSIRRKAPGSDVWIVSLPLVGGQRVQKSECTAHDLEDAKFAACTRALKYLAFVADDAVAALKARRAP